MAKIYIDKYGNETTEGPQEGVIGAATGTHSSAGLTGDNSPVSWVQGPPVPAPNGGLIQPGQGPGQWETRGMDLNPFGGHFNIDPTHREQNWIAQAPNRWYRDDNGQWQQTGPAGGNGMAPGAFVAQRPMTVQQLKAQQAMGAPETQINPRAPSMLPPPPNAPPGPPMNPTQVMLNRLPALGQVQPPTSQKLPPQWSSWMMPWMQGKLGA